MAMQSASNILRRGAAPLLVGATIVATPAVGWAEQPEYRAQLKLPALGESDAGAAAGDTRKPRLDWETGEGKSYLYPALEIVAFDVLLNQFDRHFVDQHVYASN